MDSAEPNSRWYRLTPGWLIVGLLAAEVILWLSQRYRWFAFNQHKGWTVLIAAAGVGAVLAVMLVWWLTAVVFRLRFQFSIRSLLVFALAVALPCSWLAVEMKKAKEQKEAVEEIVKLGGSVDYDWQEGQIDFSATPQPQPPGAAWLRAIVGEDFLYDVVFAELENSGVTDAGLANLKGLTALQTLWLNDCQVTDAGLVNLKGLTSLQRLSLCDKHVTDAGLVNLKGMTALQTLWLNGTAVTDAGLVNLQGLTALQVFSLQGTRVTEEGVSKLRQELPSCRIYR